MSSLLGSLGIASHREGKNTIALGDYSHSEGEATQAQGQSSHSEGTLTASIGENSHAEGFNTISKNFAQHVEGKFNKGESTETIHETGIGSNTLRKNGFEIYLDGQVKSPEQTIPQQRFGDGKHLTTVEYIDDQQVSKLYTPNLDIIELDLSTRVSNVFIEVSQETLINRPINRKRGQSGKIQIWNQTLDPIDIIFDDYWFNDDMPQVRTITIDGNYSKSTFDYTVEDENNITFKVGSSYVPHLNIQIGNGDFLAIDADGNSLVN